MKKLLVGLFAIFATSLSFGACTTDQIDIVGDGTNCIDTKFTLTTSQTDSFQFFISAAGTFYVDCGDAGTLSGTGASGKTIVRNDTTGITYTCSWNDSDNTRTIRFSGQATGYSTNNNATGAAIRFNTSNASTDTNAQKLTGISGSLGSIFSSLNHLVNGQKQPKFYNTFFYCVNLIGGIPDNLFSGVTGTTTPYMFTQTFSGCNKLSGGIPATLFSGLYGAPTSYVFAGTFYGCSNLTGSIPETLFCQNPNNPNETNCIYGAPQANLFQETFRGSARLSGTIPEKLFAGIQGAPAASMFYGTFSSCTGLTGPIPATLFAGIHGVPAPFMFYGTFEGCTNINGSIPETLFCQDTTNPDTTNCIYGQPANAMFSNTFHACAFTGNIPEKLFIGIRGAPALQMFNATFWDCNGLTGSIPEKLFCQNPNSPDATNCVYGAPKTTMFQYTFNGCSGLTGLIPTKLFAGIRGAPAERMFQSTFAGCSGLTGFTDGTKTTNYVPAEFLNKVTEGDAEHQVSTMFSSTGLAATCPAYAYQVRQAQFGDASKPWCSDSYTCQSGYYLPANSTTCTICPMNNACSGGTHTFNETNNIGIHACDTEMYAPTGSTVCYPHILHVGDNNVYLKTNKHTTPSLNIKINNDIFYANMITTPTTMNKDSLRYLRIQWPNNDYYACDDTTCPVTPLYDFSMLDPEISGQSRTYNTNNKTWTVTFPYGTVSGIGLCSITPSKFNTIGTPEETQSSELYCWCKATGFTPTDLDVTYENSSVSPWVFGVDYTYKEELTCSRYCAYHCSMHLRSTPEFRRNMFGIIQN